MDVYLTKLSPEAMKSGDLQFHFVLWTFGNEDTKNFRNFMADSAQLPREFLKSKSSTECTKTSKCHKQ